MDGLYEKTVKICGFSSVLTIANTKLCGKVDKIRAFETTCKSTFCICPRENAKFSIDLKSLSHLLLRFVCIRWLLFLDTKPICIFYSTIRLIAPFPSPFQSHCVLYAISKVTRNLNLRSINLYHLSQNINFHFFPFFILSFALWLCVCVCAREPFQNWWFRYSPNEFQFSMIFI